ncbi:hypothetical protein BJV82DRAFT_628408 [Fennellomyces sp. T-0311]|nr:hypothetical protein BJV82DRAFT_628408 [Fennellomyces sp. T-0311]
MLRTIVVLLLAFLLISTTTTAYEDEHLSHHATAAKSLRRRPRQFRMEIYSRPYHKGIVQHVGTSNGASTPCWNLQSKHVGSFEVNDPMVRISFYRSTDCLGAPTQVFAGSLDQRRHNNVLLRARSVSIVKLRPILLSETISTSKTTISKRN